MDIEETSRGFPDRIGRFRIEQKLADDAFGVVYLAEDEASGERVRLRVLPESLRTDAERRARVLADANAAMDVEHPSLATLLDVGESPSGLFLAWQHRPGRTLREHVEERRSRPYDLAEGLRIAEEIASALAAAHRAGIVHGALTDERIRVDDRGRAYVLELGLAELVRPTARRELDPQVDVYSIAALLHEMITGTRVSASEMSSDPPERLPALDVALPSAPGSLASLLTRATAPDPADRPADADRMLAALSEIDLPVEPIPEQRAEVRTEVRAASSTMWIVGASVAIAVLVTLGLVLVMI